MNKERLSTIITLVVEVIIFIVTAIGVSYTMIRNNNKEYSQKIAALEQRLDRLYTEEGQNEMKCKVKGGEWYNISERAFMGFKLDEHGKSTGELHPVVIKEKIGCFKTINKSEEVEIKL